MARARLHVEPLSDRIAPAAATLTAVGAAAGADPTVTAFASDGAVRFQARPFGADFRGGVRVAVGDVTGDGTPDVVAAAGPGGEPAVTVFDGASGGAAVTLTAFEAGFRGGVFVAVGDVDRDGFADLVLTPDEGGGPRVRVLSGDDGRVLADFFGIDDPAFRGGARAAVGDLDADGAADVVVAAGVGGGPRVAGFRGPALAAGRPDKLFADRFVFEPALRNGAFVAAGDLNADGFADLLAGGGPGGGPRVTGFDGRELVQAGGDVVLTDFFAGDPADRSGVRVAVGSATDGAAGLLTAGPDGRTRAYTVNGGPATLPGAGEAGGFVGAVGPTALPPSPPPTPPAPPPTPPVPPPPSPPSPPVTFEDADWSYYLPSGLAADRTYPVLFAFSPAGDAHAYDAVLRPLAEQHQWVVVGSKVYRNGDPELRMELGPDGAIESLGPGYARLRGAIASALTKVPGDASRVVLYGQSGGASVSHALSLAYPGLADALIVNTGMIWGDTVIGPNPGESGPVNGPYWNRYLDGNADALAGAFAAAGSRRLAAFVESPTDFRFEEMRADEGRLRAVGWQVGRFEFVGGHTVAPLDTLRQAVDWIVSSPTWQ